MIPDAPKEENIAARTTLFRDKISSKIVIFKKDLTK